MTFDINALQTLREIESAPGLDGGCLDPTCLDSQCVRQSMIITED